MNFTLLGTLNHAIELKMRLAKEAGTSHCFMDIKRNVLDIFKSQLGGKRDEYSAAVSSHFGKIGAKKRREKKEARQKLVAVLDDIREIKRCQAVKEAELSWLQEKVREGKLELSPEGDVFYLEEEEDEED